MKTRTKKATAPAKPKDNNESTTKSTAQTLGPSTSNPPHITILPSDLSASARILSLPNPATAQPSRYLLCPERGCYEFTRVAGPKRACGSWFLSPDSDEDEEGYVVQTPDLLVATPIDPLFLILPALVDEGQVQEYLALDDYVARFADGAGHLQAMLRSLDCGQLGQMFEARMLAVCDGIAVGDEMLYRLSHGKLMAELVTKTKRMVEKGLPASLEERFVKEALAVPVLSVRREESMADVVPDAIHASEATSHATLADATTPPQSQEQPSEEIIHLLRLRTALDFLQTSYVSPTLRTELSTSTSIDFTPLSNHLAHLADLRKQAQALRSLSDNISRKRASDDDDGEKNEAKKRRKEEEESRKKNVSRGVKMLGKVDRSGMKSLTSFFGKKEKT